MVSQRHITVEKQARFFVLGELSKDTKSITYVLHGYGHHPGYFIKWFDSVSSKDHVVVAPEGLSKFYNSGINGKVGASWMTKEDRETEIRDYQNYLNQLHRQLEKDVGNAIEVQIIGFSQGAATACRWITAGEMEISRLFLWAGMFPPDLEHGGDVEYLRSTDVIQVLSKKDPYYDKGMLQHQNEYLENLAIESELHYYENDHRVYPEDLKTVYGKFVPWASDLF